MSEKPSNSSISKNEPDQSAKDTQDILTIVLTGGPSAGKTKSLKALQAHLNQLGYQVLAMAETATELINGGISPASCSSVKEFQDLLFGLQLAKEETYQRAARAREGNVILLLDRGLIDNQSYLRDEEFQEILDHYDLDKQALLDRYDVIFHLESAATGNLEWYSVDNNEARFEKPEEAVLLDERISEVWKAHPNLITIAATPECSEKIETLLEKVDALLDSAGPKKG